MVRSTKKSPGARLALLIGTNKGAFIYETDEARRDWKLTGPHLAGWEVYSLVGDPRRNRLFAGTSHFVYGATIRTSTDMGRTWKAVAKGPAYGAASGFKLQRIWQIEPGHASEPGTWYAGVEDAGLFVSRDDGKTWQEVEGLTRHPSRSQWFPGGGGLCLHTILTDPTDARRMWVAASAVGVFRTEDGGKTWTTRNGGLPAVATDQSPQVDVGRCVHKMVLDPEKPGVLYQQFHGGVFRSDNRGDTWKTIASGLPGNFGFPMVVTRQGDLFVIPLDSDERRFMKNGALRVFRSRDGGRTWRSLAKGLPKDPQYVGVLRDAMAVDPLSPAGVYFGTTQGELFYSADRGDTWEQLPGQFPRITSVKAWVRR